MSAVPAATVLPHVAPSPHVSSRRTCRGTMLWVVGALVPATAWAVWNMGEVALTLLASCIGATLATEAAWNRLARRPQTIGDGSALLTGLLLALALPPRTPVWVAVAGGVVAIALGKMIFGGLGWNLFNPALVGRAFISISWAGVLSEVSPFPGGWYNALDVPGTAELDAINGATRLAIAASDRAAGGGYGFDLSGQYGALLFRNLEGCLGEVSAALLILGGAVLILRGIIDWRIPAGYIGTVALLSWALGSDPVFNILAGGLMLGAFFMATDYVTSPMTPAGRMLFGIGCGVFNVAGRFFGPMPEATTFAILFMNGLVPLIDRGFRPRTYGWRRRGA